MNWKEWLDRDDRSILTDLAERKWSPHYAWTTLSPWLHSIVSSIHFGSHQRWGIPSSTKDVKKLASEYLTWAREAQEWKELEAKWKHQEEGPWSLPFFLARSYWRFREQKYPQDRAEKSMSGQRQLLELPEPTAKQNFKWMTSPILDAFSSLTSRLPVDIRLTYQLHLEGLLNHEIASILKTNEDEIEAHIASAKSELTEDLKKGTGSS